MQELKRAAILEAAQTQPVFVTADLEENKAVDSPIQFEFITAHIATEEVASSDTQLWTWLKMNLQLNRRRGAKQLSFPTRC